MSDSYDVLSPWAEVDPVPLKGLSPRLPDVTGKTIGTFELGFKIASGPILNEVQKQLSQKFPTAKFKRFFLPLGVVVAESERHTDKYGTTPELKAEFENWLNGVDAVVGAIGD